MSKSRFFTYISFLFFFSCQLDDNAVSFDTTSLEVVKAETVKYAKGFSIEELDNCKLITLKNSWSGENVSYRYVLYDEEKPENVEGDLFIKTPIQSIACMSLTHVAFLEKLGLLNSVVALSGCDYVSSTNVRSLINNGAIKEVGQGQNVNYEMLVEESPELVMAFGVDASSSNHLNKMKRLGLNIVLNAEYMETHPLGRAEWIKFIAAFYGVDKNAAIIFDEIEKEYLSLLTLTEGLEKPTVFVGMPWNGSWYVPGAKSFQAQLLSDAGSEYLWLDNEEQSSLVKAKEVILDEAYDADFWLNQNSYSSIEEIVSYDENFKGFKAVVEKQLLNNNKRINSKSGNDYWESGVVNPHIVLRDLIEIFHPELIDHELYYYKKLE